MRARELKPVRTNLEHHLFIAPHAGARIETQAGGGLGDLLESRPMRARELKLLGSMPESKQRIAPHAGARIETTTLRDS